MSRVEFPCNCSQWPTKMKRRKLYSRNIFSGFQKNQNVCVFMVANWLQSPEAPRGVYRAIHSLDQHAHSGAAHNAGKSSQLGTVCVCFDVDECVCLCACERSRARQLRGQTETGYVTCCAQFPRKCGSRPAGGHSITPDLSVHHSLSRGNGSRCQLSAQGSQ